MAQPYALIIAPTRELAIEIHRTMLDLCYNKTIRICMIYGGAPTNDQLNELDEGCDILVATPGRLLSMLRRDALNFGQPQYHSKLSLANLHHIVYDEADELMSDPKKDDRLNNLAIKIYKEEVDEIEVRLPDWTGLYHWYFSSQYTQEQILRAEGFMRMEKGTCDVVDFGRPKENTSQRYTLIAQNFVKIGGEIRPKLSRNEQKLAYLLDVHFKPPPDGKTLILMRKRQDVNMLENLIAGETSIKVEKTHGLIEQYHREQAMFSFKHGHASACVASMKIGGRGINVAGISALIMWDLPDTLEEYKFCLGRVGRVGNQSSSTTFYEDFIGVMNKDMLSFLHENKQEIPPGMEDNFEPLLAGGSSEDWGAGSGIMSGECGEYSPRGDSGDWGAGVSGAVAANAEGGTATAQHRDMDESEDEQPWV